MLNYVNFLTRVVIIYIFICTFVCNFQFNLN